MNLWETLGLIVGLSIAFLFLLYLGLKLSSYAWHRGKRLERDEWKKEHHPREEKKTNGYQA